MKDLEVYYEKAGFNLSAIMSCIWAGCMQRQTHQTETARVTTSILPGSQAENTPERTPAHWSSIVLSPSNSSIHWSANESQTGVKVEVIAAGTGELLKEWNRTGKSLGNIFLGGSPQ